MCIVAPVTLPFGEYSGEHTYGNGKYTGNLHYRTFRSKDLQLNNNGNKLICGCTLKQQEVVIQEVVSNWTVGLLVLIPCPDLRGSDGFA